MMPRKQPLCTHERMNCGSHGDSHEQNEALERRRNLGKHARVRARVRTKRARHGQRKAERARRTTHRGIYRQSAKGGQNSRVNKIFIAPAPQSTYTSSSVGWGAPAIFSVNHSSPGPASIRDTPFSRLLSATVARRAHFTNFAPNIDRFQVATPSSRSRGASLT